MIASLILYLRMTREWEDSNPPSFKQIGADIDEIETLCERLGYKAKVKWHKEVAASDGDAE